MKIFKKSKITFAILLILVVAGLGFSYFFTKTNDRNAPAMQTTDSNYPPNKIIVIYKVGLTDTEKEQVLKSVDTFMNKYKLPRSNSQNSYTLLIEKRLNDALEVITDPEQLKNDAHTIIYLRKINSLWQVDQNAGPWCTLEEFEQHNCE